MVKLSVFDDNLSRFFWRPPPWKQESVVFIRDKNKCWMNVMVEKKNLKGDLPLFSCFVRKAILGFIEESNYCSKLRIREDCLLASRYLLSLSFFSAQKEDLGARA